jgi:O-antigen/teichoic acid export membrane protein
MVLSLVRVGGAGIGFVTQFLLAHLLTADQLGVFYFVSSTAMVAALVVGHGYPSLLSRFISRYDESGKPGYLSAFLRTAQYETIKWAVLGAVLLALAGWLAPNIDPDTKLAFLLGAVTIVPMSIQRYHGTLAVAYRKFVWGYVPALVVRPLLFALALAGFLLISATPSVALLSGIQLASFAVVAAISFYVVRGVHLGPSAPVYDKRLSRRWHSEAWPLVLVASFTFLMTDVAVILAAPFMTMADVAAFGLCLRIAFLVGFTVQVAHQVLMPDMGDAIARREGHTLNRKIIGASLAPLALTIGGIAFSVLFGDWFLGLFGPEFRAAQNTLTILMVTQFVRAIAGPGPLLLTLKGAQTLNAMICVASCVVLLIGNLLMGPIWGAEGAALSLLATTAFWLLATGVVLYRIDGARADLVSMMFRRTSSLPAE